MELKKASNTEEKTATARKSTTTIAQRLVHSRPPAGAGKQFLIVNKLNKQLGTSTILADFNPDDSRRERRKLKIVDCQLSHWGPWSPCDVECGSGTMVRQRSVTMQPQNGGKHCPSLEQRRGCQVSTCHHHQDPAIKEVAMLLPGSLSHSRTANVTSDVRKNLRLRDPQEYPQYDPEKTYCVEFEVLKASKACRKESNFNLLKEGEKVCVRCESEALHETLNWRCQGHGVQGRVTRWSALTAPHCHGKWLRAIDKTDQKCASKNCNPESAFIFV